VKLALLEIVVVFYKYMDVSENSGTPKSSILIGFSIINHPFWGTPIFGNTHMFIGFPSFLTVETGVIPLYGLDAFGALQANGEVLRCCSCIHFEK